MAVHTHNVRLRRKAVAHPSDIANIDGRAANGFYGDAIELRDGLGSRIGDVDVIFLRTDFGCSCGENQILSSNGVDHVQGGKTLRLQGLSV